MSLKTLRQSRRLSQEQLARLSGLNVRTIQRLERGAVPSVETCKCLAAGLDMDLAALELELNPDKHSAQAGRAGAFNRVLVLLPAAAVLLLVGGGVIEQTPPGEPGFGGAFFYGLAACCFVGAAVTMIRHRLGMSFQHEL